MNAHLGSHVQVICDSYKLHLSCCLFLKGALIFRFLGQNCIKLELSTFIIHKLLIKHKEEDIN